MLKKSVGNMYEWVTHVHAHLGGKCGHECAGDSWRMGAAPEITLPVLERQKFIGSIKFK
jgi:hypothetical protein